MLSELIKDLSLKQNFPDVFVEALERTGKKKTILKNFDEIMKGLDLSVIAKIAVGFSMVLASDEAVKQKGSHYFKLRFKEYFELGKPMEIPDYLMLEVMRMTRLTDQLSVPPEEITFWIESQKSVKSAAFQPLCFASNPLDAYSEDFAKACTLQPEDLPSKGTLKDVLLELGPMALQDEELFKYPSMTQDLVTRPR